MAALLVAAAIAWTLTAYFPVALGTFLVAQATTLLVAAALSWYPLLRSGWSLTRGLWSSADVR